MRLDPQPAWVTSGVWSESGLLLADSLRGRLLRYDLDGILRQVLPAAPSSSETFAHIVQVLASPGGTSIVQDGKRLIWLDENQVPVRQAELMGRPSLHGTLRALYQISLVNPDEVVAMGDVEMTDGSWIRGVVRVPLRAGAELEVIRRIAPLDPKLDLYRLGSPYLATVSGRTYFLDLREPVSLEVLPAKGETQRIVTTLSSSNMSPHIARRRDLVEPEATTALYHAIENSGLLAGLYGSKDSLYLLARRPNHDRKTSWTLTRLDPADGKELHSVVLPTFAPHLTVVPGERHWAFVERGRVESWGRQETPAVVLIPSAWIKGTGEANLSDCIMGAGTGLVVGDH